MPRHSGHWRRIKRRPPEAEATDGLRNAAGTGSAQRLLRLLNGNASAPRRLLTRRRLVRHSANSAGTRPRLTRCNAIGNIGGRNGSCRSAVVVGYSHSHSLAHVGARLASLGLFEPTRTYATAHEWHLLFSWTDRSGPSRRLFPGALVKNAPAKFHSQGLGSGFTGHG